MRVSWTAVWIDPLDQTPKAVKRTMEHSQGCIMLIDAPWAMSFVHLASLVVATDLDTCQTVVMKNRLGSTGTVQGDSRPALVQK